MRRSKAHSTPADSGGYTRGVEPAKPTGPQGLRMSSDRPPVKPTKPRAVAPNRASAGSPPEVAGGLRWLDGLLLVGFLGLTFLLGAFPLKDTDFWWHLRTGDLIRQSGVVPTVDTYTYTMNGTPWIDLHYIYQVSISWIYQRGGVPALTLAKCVVTTLAVFLLVTARRREWPLWAVLTAWLPALLVLGGRMYVRPETLSLLYLSAFLAILARIERAPALALLLPIVQIFWVNTQGLFVLGLILFGASIVDAALRPGAFAPGRKHWWRIVGASAALTGLACLVNPYGLAGALYPLQLARTMSNPVFSNSIAELTPIPVFIRRDGLISLPLRLQLVTLGLGAVSFLLPMVWLLSTRFRHSSTANPLSSNGKANLPVQVDKGKPREAKAPRRRSKKAATAATPSGWRLSPFRLLLFGGFSYLSWQATRNSHQFAAVVGTVTAWNFAEWAAAIRLRAWDSQGANSSAFRPGAGLVPRLAALVAIGGVFAWVATGGFYSATREGRTIGLGEQPLWYPREAVKFAGREGFPPKFLGFHIGHASLYEYEFAPERKVFADARLEVIGPQLYERYTDLQRRISGDDPSWNRELDSIGRPIVLTDHEGSSGVAASLMASPDWRCVWFDPIAAVFAHVAYGDVVSAHVVDFGGRHFRPEPDTVPSGTEALIASAKGLRNIAGILVKTAHERGFPLVLLGLDHARRAGLADPERGEPWKLLGVFETIRVPIGRELIPRFRLPFDPIFDLSAVRASFAFRSALDADPDDFVPLLMLQSIDESKLMHEARLPLMERLVALTPINGLQAEQQVKTAAALPAVREALRPAPPKSWENLNQFNEIVNHLLSQGRAATAADYLERAVPASARSWEETDRIATLRLHLGEPARARALWQAAHDPPRPSIREARVAVTHLVEGAFEPARQAYRSALTAEPKLFEALYGLAVLEQDAGRAADSLSAARRARDAASTDVARSDAQAIISFVTPYATSAGDFGGTAPARSEDR